MSGGEAGICISEGVREDRVGCSNEGFLEHQDYEMFYASADGWKSDLALAILLRGV